MMIDNIFDIVPTDPVVEYFNDYIVSKIISKDISREEQQLEAKDKLYELISLLYPEEKVKYILDDKMRPIQYLYFLALLESAAMSTDKVIDILSGVMNSGKSYIITSLFPILFDISRHCGTNIDSIFIGAYKNEVVQQYFGDLISSDSIKYMSEIFYTSKNNRSLIIINPSEYEYSNNGRTYGNISIFPSIQHILPSKLINADIIVLDTLHTLSPNISVNKHSNILDIFKNKNGIAIIDEAHAGMGFQVSPLFTYFTVNGYDNREYKAELYNGMVNFPYFKKIVATTGTATKAHKYDHSSFRMIGGLITKKEVEEYSKFATVRYAENYHNRLKILFAEYNKLSTMYPDRKITAYIEIPKDSKSTPTNLLKSEILEYAHEYGYTEDNFLWHYTTNEDSFLEDSKVVSNELDSYKSNKKFVVVKNAFSAGINVKGICFMTTLKEDLLRGVKQNEAFHNQLQKLMRVPRFYTNVENNAKNRSDLKTKKGKDLNTVLYIFPGSYKPVINKMNEHYLNVKDVTPFV